MNPTSTAVVIRGALQQASIAYKNSNYIGDQVFPIIDGMNRQAKILKYNKAPWFRNGAAYRSEGAVSQRADFTITTSNFDPKEVSMGAVVTDELVAATGEPGSLPVKPITDALELCADKIDLFKEKTIADKIFAQTWADGVSGGHDAAGGWAATSSNPFITDILGAKQTIQQKIGLVPNTLVLDYATFLALQNADVMIDRIKYTSSGVVTTGLIASLLQLDNVLIGTAIYTTDVETGSETGAMTTVLNIWEKNATKGSAFLFYRPRSAGLKTPSAGYQYRMQLEGGARRSISYREEAQHQTVYEVAEFNEISVMDLNLGYLWKDTIVD